MNEKGERCFSPSCKEPSPTINGNRSGCSAVKAVENRHDVGAYYQWSSLKVRTFRIDGPYKLLQWRIAKCLLRFCPQFLDSDRVERCVINIRSWIADKMFPHQCRILVVVYEQNNGSPFLS